MDDSIAVLVVLDTGHDGLGTIWDTSRAQSSVGWWGVVVILGVFQLWK